MHTYSVMKTHSNWALEYKHDEHKRQSQIRITFWAFVALLIFALLLAFFLGNHALVSLLRKM